MKYLIFVLVLIFSSCGAKYSVGYENTNWTQGTAKVTFKNDTDFEKKVTIEGFSNTIQPKGKLELELTSGNHFLMIDDEEYEATFYARHKVDVFLSHQ